MNPLRPYRIVVGMDMSNDHALTQGLALLERMIFAELHVVHVLPPVELRFGDELAKEDQRIGEAYDALDRAVREGAQHLELGGVDRSFEAHVRIGEPAKALLEVVVDVDADLLIVGASRASDLARIVFASTENAVLDVSRIPVLVAHPKNLTGLEKTRRPEPTQPGDALEDGTPRPESRVDAVPLASRIGHISGLV